MYFWLTRMILIPSVCLGIFSGVLGHANEYIPANNKDMQIVTIHLVNIGSHGLVINCL